MPLPLSPRTWAAEWGVDLDMEQPAGLTTPEAPHPARKVYLMQRKTSKPGAPVFHRTVGLKDSWQKAQAKAAPKGGAPGGKKG